MDKKFDLLWDVFDLKTNIQFNNITGEAADFFESQGVSLAAAECAKRIYDKDYRETVTASKKYSHVMQANTVTTQAITKYKIVFDLITKKGKEDAEAILLIRGTKVAKNWQANFSGGILFSLFVIFKVAVTYFAVRYLVYDTTILGKESSTAVRLIAMLVFAIPVCTVLNLGFGCIKILEKWLYHKSYHKLAEEFAKLISNHSRVLLIGHSLSGGVIDEMLYSNPKKKWRGIIFNKAPSRAGSLTTHYSAKILDYRYRFDLLTTINNTLIRNTSSSLYLSPSKLNGIFWVYFGIYVLFVIFSSVASIFSPGFSSNLTACFDYFTGFIYLGLLLSSVYRHSMSQNINALKEKSRL